MSYTPIAFESSRVKEAARKDIREAREALLDRAKQSYERRVKKEERSRERGDDKWMLPSVEARVASESSSNKKSKKHKKKKKKRKKHSSSVSGSSSEEEWVEKTSGVGSSGSSQPAGNVPDKPTSGSVTTAAQSQRDEWMSLPGLIPCVTRVELRQNSKPAQQRKEEAEQKFMLDRPGQSAQELNPYWRDGGTGLPQAPDEELRLPQKAVGDQGAGWLRKALQRVHEQAAESGRSVEDVAAERWGSLAKLESLLAEAEGRKRQPQESRRYESQRERSGRDSQGRDERRKDRPKFARPADDFDDTSKRERSHKPHDHYSQHGALDQERKRYQKPPDERTNENKQRDKFEKPNDDQARSSRHTESRRRDDERQADRPRHEQKSGYREDERRRAEHTARNSLKFQKPGDDDDERETSSRFVSRSSGSRNWQKKEARPDAKVEPQSSKPRTRSISPSSSSLSSEEEPVRDEPIKVLSEKEMNDIGARIVKAEILGNEALAKELKAQLESARTARESAKASRAAGGTASGSQEEEVVILTRTDSRGVTRPLAAPQYEEPSGGRRKKQKVETHNKSGQRERYFPDDDKYRLQDMFTKEKLNTVEDSNNEFAKLISKGAARAGNGEYDLDDMFEEKARFKESDGKMQAREREQAMREHNRVSRALDGCRLCIDSKQMLKHLIIAIGSKVYLSLPPYQSLTAGHCLLAPTLHSPCATQLDEDVWAEMQVFRKALTRMFASKGEDVVFFETARNLRGFPHMVLECVPLDRESGGLAPIYFKKAIQECEMEWSTNKKLVELAGKGVRRAIPKGLPYFTVCFGDDDGFGHVIEDEKQFPPNFAQEIIGGILDLDHQLWRKRRNENFEVQRKKVLEFAKDWAPFDFTTPKQKKTQASSSSDTD